MTDGQKSYPVMRAPLTWMQAQTTEMTEFGLTIHLNERNKFPGKPMVRGGMSDKTTRSAKHDFCVRQKQVYRENK